MNTKLRVSACKTVNHVTTINILLYSLFWCNLVPILNCLFFQKGCSPCNQRHSSHFSDTGSWYTCHTSLKSSLLSSCRRRPPPALPSFVGEMWPQAPPVRWRCILFAGQRPAVTDSLSRSSRWEITIWSKTASSENRVSAGIVVRVLGPTEPRGHRRDPAFQWMTGLRPHWPLCRYPVSNLPVTRTQSNDAARPKSRRRFALRHADQSKSSPAGCSWEKKEKGVERGMEVGEGWREDWIERRAI